MTQAVITQLYNISVLFLYEDGELVECHPLTENPDLQIGNIYIGRVEKVVKNIQSAFIRLDKEHVGYLPLQDKPAMVLNRQLPKGLPSIAENDLILVQVEQEPQKMKQARVTGNISLSGEYAVLDLSAGFVGVSKRISDRERVAALKGMVREQMSGAIQEASATPFGIVLRTAAENAPDSVISGEISHLIGEMEQILQKGKYERTTGLIYSGKPEVVAILEEYGLSRIDEIRTDLPEIYAMLEKIYPSCVLYTEEYPLTKLLGLETEFARMLHRKVWLSSGGFLVIEPTEAMVVIDVNTGKSVGKKNMDKHILKVNLEAAREVAKQLRLRNLSGMILVDFINMEAADYKKQLVDTLKRELARDKIKTSFIDITKLDLYELTRKKQRRPLHELCRWDAKENSVVFIKEE